MDRPRLYLDEDVYAAVALGLRRRGFDVLTTVEADRLEATDEEQLQFAAADRRCLFTFNRGHFARLHAEVIAIGRHHFGVVLSPQAGVGTTVRSLSALLSTRTADELRDQLIWLTSLR